MVDGYLNTPEQTVFRKSKPERFIAFDYLRSFAIVFVVLYHSFLAYSNLASINLSNPIDTISPIVDAQKWIGFDIIILFGNTFGMSLLFFISGFFVWGSYKHNGSKKFLSRRMVKLLVPFILGVLIFIPIAIYPAELQVDKILNRSSNFIDYWLAFATAGFWQPSHLWFLWVLFAFNIVVVVIFSLFSKKIEKFKTHDFSNFGDPISMIIIVIIFSVLTYAPMMLLFGTTSWTQIVGPFIFQSSRFFLYLSFFLFGSLIGIFGLDQTIFSPGSKLAKNWWKWSIAGVIVFLFYLAILIDPNLTLVYSIAYPLTCAFTIFAVIAIFLRFFRKNINIFDSLSENSYGIYFIHYLFVVWFQFLLLDLNISLFIKLFVVFIGSLGMSWILLLGIKRIVKTRQNAKISSS